MNIKKLPVKAIAIITLSATFVTACDDTRVRISADTGPRYHSGHVTYHTHTPHNHRVAYDAALGMYVVLGLLNTYWNGNNYYRYHNHGWQSSSDYRRWNRVGHRHIPGKLHRKHFKKRRNNRHRIITHY